MSTITNLGVVIAADGDAPDISAHVAAPLQQLSNLLEGVSTDTDFKPKFALVRVAASGPVVQSYDAAGNIVYDSGAGDTRTTWFEGPAGAVTTIVQVGKSGNLAADIIYLNAVAGGVKFGTYSALGAETLQGFITIQDVAGNSRKIGVVA